MKKTLGIFTTLFFSAIFTFAQGGKYEVSIDLTQAENDQLTVMLKVPPSSEEFVEYHMPKIVPGTYDISDFGRFVTDFTAVDQSGKPVEAEQVSTNKWKIAHGGNLKSISYKVHDTWDQFDEYGDNIVFEPGGTNINAEDDVFVLNTFGFIGYIDGQKFLPYEVNIKHSEKTFGATALKKEQKSPTLDTYFADDYNFLADGPIMYSEPDTVTRKIANAEVIVSVFSPNDVLSAADVMDKVYDLMVAQSEYLGGNLPVERYAYLIYLNDGRTLSGAMGALEHSYSSVYSLPEAGVDRIGQTVRDVAAHEFFHIVTPLNIHSKEIGEFNYIEPEMSKHLWLYEGVTEYSSMHVQVKYNLYSPEVFLEEIQRKLVVADRFPSDVAFTEMSENILEPDYAKMYSNVYYKGALIGMCLDLYLIKYSNGEKDLQWLMRELAKKYGKEVSFDDDELFDVITSLTYPEIGEFLNTYVGGNEPLPIEEVLGWAGIEYKAEVATKEITLGGFGLSLNEDQDIYVDDISNINEFGEKLGLQEGDIITELNGEAFNISTAQALFNKVRAEAQEGDKITMVVKREKKGKMKNKRLKAKAMVIDSTDEHVILFKENPTEEEYKVLQSWIVAGK